MNREIPGALQELWLPLSDLLLAFGKIQDRLDPPKIPEYLELLAPRAEALQHALTSQALSNILVSDPSGRLLARAASQAMQGASRFAASRAGPHEMLKAFQALRPVARSQEILYPLAGKFDDVSRFFLHPSRADDADLTASLRERTTATDSDKRGLMHVDHDRGRRGGYSLYVPEYYSKERAWPLVVGLHGGSGHGADFLWSWLRDARTFGFILAAPSSLDRTWSLHTPGVDAAALNRMLQYVSENWNIDTKHILLTGISDGGTYAMLLSVVHQSPFTHFAPVAAAVHVLMNRQGVVLAPVKDVPIYQVHGGRDWMFPVEHARQAALALEKAGAKITYREIPDLSHNYPRDENEAILRWFYPLR